MARVIDPRPHHGVPGRRVDPRIDGDNPGLHRRGGAICRENLDDVVLPQTRGDLLLDREVHVGGLVDALQRGE
jgi:hypothetical protein